MKGNEMAKRSKRERKKRPRTSPQKNPAVLPSVPAAPARCFRCDGEGEVCERCGEAEQGCDCEADGNEYEPSDCPDCGGTGK